MPSSYPAQSILSVIRLAEYPESLHCLLVMIGTETSCNVFETSPLLARSIELTDVEFHQQLTLLLKFPNQLQYPKI